MIEIILWLIFTYFGWYYLVVYLEKRRSPPGPLPIPLLGNLVQLALATDANTPSLVFDKFSKKYGEVFQLKMGMKTVVVPASVEAITTILNQPESSGRDHTGSFHDRNLQKNLGIIFGDGPSWEKTKQWTIRSLRAYGFGKSALMESSIYEELQMLFSDIDKSRALNNNVVNMSGIFLMPIFKILWQMIAGHCTDDDIKVISNLLVKSEELAAKGCFGAGLITAYPFIRFIIPESTGHNAQMSFYKDAHIAARDLLLQTRKTIEQKKKDGFIGLKPESLVEAFLYKAEEERGISDTIFTDENFIVIYMDLLQAGSDTNSAFMESFLLFMILYPDVQAKVIDEIEQFGPKNENLTVGDREKMIYTQATMWEVHRHSRVVTNLVPRRVEQDFNYKQYLIKKDTLVIANLYSAYFSQDVWDDPMAFRPERFIENGNLIKLNCLMPFGVGKRLCPGEMLSHFTSFLYMTSILKKYKLSNVPRQRLPSQTLQEGFTCKPYAPFEIVLTDRY